MSSVLQRNNVTVVGQGEPTLLLAHGFGCDQSMWRAIVPAFEQDHRIVLFDYVGCGGSDFTAYDSARYRTLEGYAQDILDVCDALDLTDVVLVGHSVSGIIGLLAAIEQPDRFAHLVMVSPSPCYINDPPDYHGGFEREDLEGLLDLMDKNTFEWAHVLAPTVMKNDDQPELAAELEQSFCAMAPQAAREFAAATFFSDYRDAIAKAPVPALVLQCSDDSIAPDSVGTFTHEHLPQSTFAQLEATGHCPHMSHPDEVIEVLRGYLDHQLARA